MGLLGSYNGEGQVGGERGSLSRSGFHIEAAAEFPQPLPHEVKPKAGRGAGRFFPRLQVKAFAIINHIQAHRVLSIDQAHNDLRSLRM